MKKLSTGTGSYGPDHEVERHLKTISMIEADLAKQYQKDFPEVYFRENFNMDRLFALWHSRFGKKVADLLEHDLHMHKDKSLTCRYERGNNEEDCQLILDQIKRAIYKDL